MFKATVGGFISAFVGSYDLGTVGSVVGCVDELVLELILGSEIGDVSGELIEGILVKPELDVVGFTVGSDVVRKRLGLNVGFIE